VARLAAPLAFLLAATVAVLLIRSALDEPEDVPVAPPSATTSVETETRAAETSPAPRYYVVKSGDTLEAIAARHGTSVEKLLELNPDVDPVALTIGQRIRVG
jgi:LysM repeat protein